MARAAHGGGNARGRFTTASKNAHKSNRVPMIHWIHLDKYARNLDLYVGNRRRRRRCKLIGIVVGKSMREGMRLWRIDELLSGSSSRVVLNEPILSHT